MPLAVMGVANVPAGTPIDLDCRFGPGNGGTVRERQIFAIPVG